MSRSGQTLPVIEGGITVSFMQTSRDTGGDALVFEAVISPQSRARPHVHTWEERFQVVSGSYNYWVGSRRHARTFGVGEEMVFPPRVPHRHWNAGPGDVRVISERRPAGQHETGLEFLSGLNQAGRTTKRGSPTNLLEAALVLQLLETYPAGVPLPLARAIVGALVRLATRLGYQERIAKYTKRTSEP